MSNHASAPQVLDHEKLDVYRAAIDLLVACEDVARHLPSGRAYMRDQLRRAALSVANNTAEGAGEFAPMEKARFYRIARRSGTECAAMLDAARALELIDDGRYGSARGALVRVIQMLTRLARRHGERQG
ncbi:MAG: four helix bundle protein [Planctomycetota bacterium]|nr:four helix bundle protein [Planctomycetota bacterium]